MDRRSAGVMDRFAAQLRRLMPEDGISGNALARKVYVDPALICRYRSGKQQPSERIAKLIDDVLGAGGELVALAAQPGRRAVLAASGLAGLAAVLGPELGDRLAWVAHHPLRLDMAAVDALAVVLAGQRHAEDALGSAAMLRPVIAQLGVVEQLTTEARGPLRLALLDVGQQWAQFAAHLCRHAGDVAGARACGAQALEWAEELGDRTMISTLLVSRGYLAAEAGEVGPM